MAAYISFQPSDYYNTVLYTGNGSTNAVTGVGFQPDFTWIKNRLQSDNHYLCDSVRGATKYIESGTNIAQVTNANGLSVFGSDGFTVGTQGSQVNDNTDSYVSWNWKAGTTTGIDATGATITPTSYSFNQTAGFSIIEYSGNATSGATIPHGLGVKPDLVIIKNLAAAQNWGMYYSPLGATKYLRLNMATAGGTSTGFWNDTEPTTTLVSLGDEAIVSGSGNAQIAYCFANKIGYLKVGEYEGNNNVDGPFIHTGFRPAYVMIKNFSTTDTAVSMDSKRDGFNLQNQILSPTETYVEQDPAYGVDLLSNGFKCRRNDGWTNGGGDTMVYVAFAEFPFVSSNSIPTVAR